MPRPPRRFPRVPVYGTVRALLKRVSESDSLPITLRTVSEGGVCVVVPGALPDPGARVTVEMALWRQMLYLPGNVVWSRFIEGSPHAGVKLHLEVTDSTTRRAFAGWVRNQAVADDTAPVLVRGCRVQAPAPEKPYELDVTEMDTVVSLRPESRLDQFLRWLRRR